MPPSFLPELNLIQEFISEFVYVSYSMNFKTLNDYLSKGFKVVGSVQVVPFPESREVLYTALVQKES